MSRPILIFFKLHFFQIPLNQLSPVFFSDDSLLMFYIIMVLSRRQLGRQGNAGKQPERHAFVFNALNPRALARNTYSAELPEALAISLKQNDKLTWEPYISMLDEAFPGCRIL
jgi:hypothetical protein